MTEEQIKQNAEAYACPENSCLSDIEKERVMTHFIAGAHSRDEEFALLKAEIEDDNAVMKQLKDELAKAENPWRDGNEKPQDIYCDYLLDYGEHYRAAMYDSGMWMSYDLHPLKQPIRWMPIPSVEGGDV